MLWWVAKPGARGQRRETRLGAALISAESRVTDLDELAHFYGDGLRLAVTVDQ